MKLVEYRRKVAGECVVCHRPFTGYVNKIYCGVDEHGNKSEACKQKAKYRRKTGRKL